MAAIPPLSDNVLTQICDILGDTATGLTGTQIASYLRRVGIEDVEPGITKRIRLYRALSAQQAKDKCANNVLRFIKTVMDPVSHVDRPDYFESKKSQLNCVLVFSGIELRDDGELVKAVQARTISEAVRRADRLQSELLRRGVHPDVLKFCRQELVQNNCFHAVLEAAKSIADKIRSMSGLSDDGSELVDKAFGLGKDNLPYLAFNSLTTETQISEHRGYMNLIKGVFGAFRNVTAHAPKVTWPIYEQDALDLLTTASLIHRKLDTAVRTPKK